VTPALAGRTYAEELALSPGTHVNFTPREDKTIDFSDHDQTYKAVLHRCPD
jgi:hypothetical protein